MTPPPDAMSTDPRFIAHHGHLPEVGPRSFVADTARLIGDVRVGEGTSIWFGVVVRGDVFHVRIGAHVNIQDMTMVHVTSGRYATLVEDEVTVGHRVVLHGCTIRRRALIGMSAVVMDQAEVGEEAMVGAGALVTPGTIIPPRTLAIGAPARVKRDLTEAEIANLAESAAHYERLAASYLAQGVGRVDLE